MPLLSRNRDREAQVFRQSVAAYEAGPASVRDQDGLEWQRRAQGMASRGMFAACANPGCGSGWIKLWRSRSAPVFEGGWSCSDACTAYLVEAALRRESETLGNAQEVHRHRIPLGLTMLEQGWITSSQLRLALEAQKAAGGGRLGQWLVRQQGVSEQMVTRALGLQWNCPVLGLELHDAASLTALLPRLPLRVAAGRILYLGFEAGLDPVLALAVERMTSLRVESGLVQESLFRAAHTRILNAKFPPVELIEAATEPALVQALAKRVELARPVESRLVRMHDCLWLRMWTRPQRGPLPEAESVQDLICSLRSN
jgi:hypothetical protein